MFVVLKKEYKELGQASPTVDEFLRQVRRHLSQLGPSQPGDPDDIERTVRLMFEEK